MEAAAAKSKLDRYVMVPAALLAAQRSGVMPADVTPGAVVVAPAAEPPAAVVAVMVAGAAVVPFSADVVLSLPQAATSRRARAPGRRRRGRFVMGPPGSSGTSWARPVLGAVPAQHHPLEHADQEDPGGAEKGEHEDRAPQLQRQVEGLRLLH